MTDGCCLCGLGYTVGFAFAREARSYGVNGIISFIRFCVNHYCACSLGTVIFINIEIAMNEVF